MTLSVGSNFMQQSFNELVRQRLAERAVAEDGGFADKVSEARKGDRPSEGVRLTGAALSEAQFQVEAARVLGADWFSDWLGAQIDASNKARDVHTTFLVDGKPIAAQFGDGGYDLGPLANRTETFFEDAAARGLDGSELNDFIASEIEEMLREKYGLRLRWSGMTRMTRHPCTTTTDP
ncbi:MAG: hypothetical protein AAF409_09485 [Pseudomonadota bacterium]